MLDVAKIRRTVIPKQTGVAVMAVAPELTDLRASGYSNAQLRKILKDECSISVSANYLYRLLRRYKEQHPEHVPQQPQPVQSKPATSESGGGLSVLQSARDRRNA